MDKSLLAVIEVPYDLRVRCSAPGCGHFVHKRVHIVKLGGELRIYGSTCFAREFAGQAILFARPHFHSGAARVLSSEERDLLVLNTERLVQRFEKEHAAKLEQRFRKARPTGLAESQQAQVGRTKFSQEERAAVEPEALSNLQVKFGGLNFYSPGFNGLLQSEIDRILRSKSESAQ